MGKPRTWYVFARIRGAWCIDWRGDMAARPTMVNNAPYPFADQHPAPYKE